MRMPEALTRLYERHRAELTAYLCRLVVRPQVAEDLAQTTYLRCYEAANLPDSEAGIRAWLFKVASHLAFDELRRHATWRETVLFDLREATEADPAMLAHSRAMAGSPDTQAIAREHLVACLACTLRNLPERQAAAVLLKETHGFTVEETAALLDATPAQAKNWLQEGRAYLRARYGATCALIAKTGVCHQCVELDAFFDAGQGAPLAETALDARLKVADALRQRPWGRWHRLVFGLLDAMA